MLKKLRQKFLDFLRQLIGTSQIRQQLQLMEINMRQQKEMFLVLSNALKYSFADQEDVKTSVTYQRCAEIISLLSPMDIAGGKFVRVGKNNDGGYVMLDDLKKETIDAAYSFGISNDVSWDESIAARGIDVFMYDHTIDRLPMQHPGFHYFETGVTGHKKGTNLKTLSEIITANHHTSSKNLIMKMDIEDCEWDVFDETSSDIINKFSQIVIEFHRLYPSVFEQKYFFIINVLNKINQTHQSIHVHANNYMPSMWIEKLVLPDVLEVTYIRRSDAKDRLLANTRRFPTEADQPNMPGSSDIYLDRFSIGGRE
jgi:hypothetical protein